MPPSQYQATRLNEKFFQSLLRSESKQVRAALNELQDLERFGEVALHAFKSYAEKNQ